MRTAGNNDFQVDVDGIGRFTFGRKTMRDIYAIRGEYAAVTANNFTDDGAFADIGAWAFITLGRQMVAAPAGFSLDIDPVLDDGAEEKIVKVFFALREKEQSFRPQPQSAVAGTGQATS